MSRRDVFLAFAVIVLAAVIPGCQTDIHPKDVPTRDEFRKASIQSYNPEPNKYKFIEGPTIDFANNQFVTDRGFEPIDLCSTKEILCFKSASIALALPLTCPNFALEDAWPHEIGNTSVIADSYQPPFTTPHMPLETHSVVVSTEGSKYLFLLEEFGKDGEYHLMGLFDRATFDDSAAWWTHGAADYPIIPLQDDKAMCTR